MKNLSLKLPDELHARIARASEQRGTAKSDIVREALDAFFSRDHKEDEVSCADLAGDLVGCVEGPGDLATNPKHLRGYGK